MALFKGKWGTRRLDEQVISDGYSIFNTFCRLAFARLSKRPELPLWSCSVAPLPKIFGYLFNCYLGAFRKKQTQTLYEFSIKEKAGLSGGWVNSAIPLGQVRFFSAVSRVLTFLYGVCQVYSIYLFYLFCTFLTINGAGLFTRLTALLIRSLMLTVISQWGCLPSHRQVRWGQ